MTKKKVQNLLKHLVCILLCLTVILPFYMVVINSFKSKGEASRMSLALPKEWLFSNYTEVIDKGNLIQGFSNSLLYALVATTLGVVLCAMAAFVMASSYSAIFFAISVSPTDAEQELNTCTFASG